LRSQIAARDAPAVKMHADQLDVSPETVREVVDEQFPEWRSLPVRRIASQGTDNAIFRIGDRLAARFPLRGSDAASVLRWLEAEAEAARELAGRTPYPTPEPIALGEPGRGYPLPWSVQTWLPGAVATDEDPGESAAFAHDLAEFIRGVRAIGTRGRTFSAEGRRGGELRAHDGWMRTCFEHSEQLLEVPRLREMWAVMRELPRGTAPDVMNHGDLIPGNVLVSRGRLAGVIDVGGLGPADPALDLVGAWHLLAAGPRQMLRDDLQSDHVERDDLQTSDPQPDDLEWERGKAWAFVQALGLVWYYAESNPAMSRMGRRTLERITADEPSA
jgi:aminoglycoside phosphotransferase (APT) family kinase protein